MKPEADPAWRECLRADIHQGLTEGRWGWRRSIAPALERENGIEEDSRIRISHNDVDSLITEAEALGEWTVAWAEEQLAKVRATYPKPARQRTYARGEQAGNAKLTQRQVRSIRARYAAGRQKLQTADAVTGRLSVQTCRRAGRVTVAGLAQEFGVSARTIRRILDRETWRGN